MRAWNPLTQPFQRPYAPVAAGLSPEAETPAKMPPWLRGLVGVTRALSALEATTIYGLEAIDPFNIIPGSRDDRPFKERLKSTAYLARDIAGLSPVGPAVGALARLPGVEKLVPDQLVPFDRETSGLRAAAEYGFRRIPKLPGEEVMDTSGTGERAFGARVAERYYNWQDAPGGEFQKTVISILADPTTWLSFGTAGAVKAGAKETLEAAGETAIKRAGQQFAREAAERAARAGAESAAEKSIGRRILPAVGRGALELGLGVGPKKAVPFAFGAAAGQEAGRWLSEQLPGDNPFLQVAGALGGSILGGGIGAGMVRDRGSLRLGVLEEGAETEARRAAQAAVPAEREAEEIPPQYVERLEKMPGWQNSHYAQYVPPDLAAKLGLRAQELAVLYSSTPDTLYSNLRRSFFDAQMARLSPAERKTRAAEVNKAADEYARSTKGLIDQIVNYKEASLDIETAAGEIADAFGEEQPAPGVAEDAVRRQAVERLATQEALRTVRQQQEQGWTQGSQQATPDLRERIDERVRQTREQQAPMSEDELEQLRERARASVQNRPVAEEPGNPFWRETDEDPDVTLARAETEGLRTEENSSPVETGIEEGEGYYYVSLFHEDADPRAQIDLGAQRVVEDAFDMSTYEIRRDPVLRARAARAFEQIREGISDYYYRRVIQAEREGTTVGDELRLPWERVEIDEDGNVRFHARRLGYGDRVATDDDARIQITRTQEKAAAIPEEREEMLGLPAIEMEGSGDARRPIAPAARSADTRIARPDVAPPGKPSSLSENVAWREQDVQANAPNAIIVTDGKNSLGLPDPREIIAPPHRNTTANPNYEVMRSRAEAQGKAIAQALAQQNPQGPVVIAIRNTPGRLDDSAFALAREAASLLSSQIRKALREMAGAATGEERERLLRLADNVYVIPQLRPGIREADDAAPRTGPFVREEPGLAVEEESIRREARRTSRAQNLEQQRLRELESSRRRRVDEEGEETEIDISDQDIVSAPRRVDASREEAGLEGRTPRNYETVRVRIRRGSPYVRRTGGRPEDVEVTPVDEIIRPRLTGEAEEPDDLRAIREAFEEARNRPGAASRAKAAQALKTAVYELQDAATDLDRFASRWKSSADDQRAVFVDRSARAEQEPRKRLADAETEEERLAILDELEERREESARGVVNRIIRATKEMLSGEAAPDEETGGLRETYFDVADRTQGTYARPLPDDGNYVEGQPYINRSADGRSRLLPMEFHPDTGRWVPKGFDSEIRSYAPAGVSGPQSGRMRVTAVVAKQPYLLVHNGRLNQYRPAYITIWWRNEEGVFRPVRTMYTVHADAASRIAAFLTEITTAINTLFDAKVFVQERRTGMVRAVVDPIGALAYALALSHRNAGYRPVEVAENFMRRLESILADPSPARVNEALIALASIRDAALRNAGYIVSPRSVKIPADPIAKTRRQIAESLKPQKEERPPRARAPDIEERLGRPLTEEERARVDEYREIIRRALGKETAATDGQEVPVSKEQAAPRQAEPETPRWTPSDQQPPEAPAPQPGRPKRVAMRYDMPRDLLRPDLRDKGDTTTAQLIVDGQRTATTRYPGDLKPGDRMVFIDANGKEIPGVYVVEDIRDVPKIPEGPRDRLTPERQRQLDEWSRLEGWDWRAIARGQTPMARKLREQINKPGSKQIVFRRVDDNAESAAPKIEIEPESRPEPRRVLPADAANHGPHGKVDADLVELDEAAVREAAADGTPVAEAYASTRAPLGKVTEADMLALGYVRDPDGVWTKTDSNAWPWQRIAILSSQASLRRRSVLIQYRARGEAVVDPDQFGREKVISLGTYEAPTSRRDRARGRRPTPDDPDPLYRSDPEGELAETLQYQIHPFNAHIKLQQGDPLSMTEALRETIQRSGQTPVGSFEGKIEDFRTVFIRRGGRKGHVGFHDEGKRTAQVEARSELEPGELPEMVQVMRLYALYFSQHPDRWDNLVSLLRRGWVLSDNAYSKRAWDASPAVPIAYLYESGFKPDPRFAGDYRPSALDVVDYMRGKKSLDEIAPGQVKDVEMAEDAVMACVFDALGLEE